ncbi:Na+/H+ antiporter NhaA [Pseudorhodoplanes sinuspersici]|uniref:Na(+)/H(+) antiporter NhaA n=1 Tax=Pseudorhodoplanes sinuspersici TaxID=1235591 RepID=A0A1W6ZQZ4_9HYPH|nr:Na+/H+ antiporter NhaA [Pseudorhodoplanes sinuspersici]ARP99818.1 Na+/H+ antiporter NhaA [Pseudorhodoplanes sinuspersici]RKE70826.1 sodium/proton antiporter (NhaA family) [Pseudorhodoplanes sinuspersici]
MAHVAAVNWLNRPVDESRDHVLGPSNAEITLVEYGSYDCPYCRRANERIADIRDQLGDRLRYVFRHKPITGSEIARRAADLAECAATREQFWDAHVKLMSRSATLTEDDLRVVRADLGLPEHGETKAGARHKVDEDIASAKASGVRFTPTFFINGRRYDGAWDEASFYDAMLGRLGHRVRAAALDFASWAPSTGALLLLATVVAVLLTNSPLGHALEEFWERPFGLSFGDANFSMSLRHWINDALLSVFFLVVGLEIKREFTVGRLVSRRSAALPIAGAIGGMAAPALLYLLIVPQGPWSHGWGVPMATDTAFAVALIAMLGARVPIELRIFLTAAAIVDDIGAIIVVAIFYSSKLDFAWLALAVIVFGALFALNRAGVYRTLPYMVLGTILWISVHAGGLHATLAGVLLAFVIPTLPPADLKALMAQATAIINVESQRAHEAMHHGPSSLALRGLDAIHDRLESPADRLLRHVEPWSSYVVLPLFALANAGVIISTSVLGGGHEYLMLAIIAGLSIGKPLGMTLLCALAVWVGVARKPKEYSWTHLAGAGALAGIGFTMSLFIAGQAFALPADFAAAKIAVFAASVLSAIIGIAILLAAPAQDNGADEESGDKPSNVTPV